MYSYNKRMQRTLNAVRMEKVDKIPFAYSGPAYNARRQGLSIAEFLADYNKATQAVIDFCNDHPGIDSVHSPVFCPDALKMLWLSEVKVPGPDLPEDELWQVCEAERMTEEDYETITKIGYAPWLMQYFSKIGNPLPALHHHGEQSAIAAQRIAQEANVLYANPVITGSPIEGFCGGRQLMNFFLDIMEEPELVKAAMDKAQEFLIGNFTHQLEEAKPFGAWVGGWRAAPELMSHDTWMEFVWPYLKEYINVAIAHDVVPILHFDSCWESELETLKELPAKKCLLMLDGFTDPRKAREILDDRMAIMGDVPSTMLAFGTANDVYNYVTKLIDDVGPKTGLIVSSGCDCPLNAKDENVDAMIQATLDYQV